MTFVPVAQFKDSFNLLRRRQPTPKVEKKHQQMNKKPFIFWNKWINSDFVEIIDMANDFMDQTNVFWP